MSGIETVADQDKLLIQNSVQYLANLTQLKSLSCPTLKSLYRTKCRLMELRQHIQLAEQTPYRQCKRCFMDFSSDSAKFEIQQVKLSSFAKKVFAKAKKQQTLTKFQRNYHKQLLKKVPNGFERKNKLILTCNFCRKKTEVWMDKPKKNKKKLDKTPLKRKKKSRKDKFCGLNKTVVLSSLSEQKAIQTEVSISSENTEAKSVIGMTNTRAFHTEDFIPLDTTKKKFKFPKKKTEVEVSEPPPPGVVKLKEKTRQKNLKSLGTLLKKAENKSRPSTQLKQFLNSL